MEIRLSLMLEITIYLPEKCNKKSRLPFLVFIGCMKTKNVTKVATFYNALVSII
jgi:hypothetical protein